MTMTFVFFLCKRPFTIDAPNIAIVDKVTLQQLGKISRDFRSMLAKKYVFGKKKHQNPRLIYTEIEAASWERFKVYAQQYKDKVSLIIPIITYFNFQITRNLTFHILIHF